MSNFCRSFLNCHFYENAIVEVLRRSLRLSLNPFSYILSPITNRPSGAEGKQAASRKIKSN
ncbi:hypothetical protein J6590_057931, partial [Homalodisca vitripennis]